MGTQELQPATSPELTGAYQRLLKSWQPDRFTGEEKEKMESKFRQLTGAFSALMDVDPRGAGGDATPRATPQGPKPQDFDPDGYFQTARKARDAGEKPRALGLVLIALRKNPRNVEYILLYSELLVECGGDLRSAIQSLETALALSPRSAEVMIKLAELYTTIGMTARASALLMKAKAIAPNHKRFRMEAARTGKPPAPPMGLGGQVRSLFRRFFK